MMGSSCKWWGMSLLSPLPVKRLKLSVCMGGAGGLGVPSKDGWMGMGSHWSEADPQ